MFFTVEKFQRRAEEMAVRRYVDMVSIAPMTSMEDTLDRDTVHTEALAVVEGPLFQQGDHFVGRDKYLWLEKTVRLPEARDGYEVVGRFDFGKTGGGFNSAFESLLYVDGTRYQGVDTFHNDVVFQDLAGQEARLTFLLWTGLEGGGPHVTFYHQFKQAEIGYLHKAADEMYYFTRAIAGSLPLMSPDDPLRAKLEQALEKALLVINWDHDRYLDTVTEALSVLMTELDKIEARSDITAYVVGHSHIDVAWLWRLKHTREKAQRTFSTVLRYMEEFDEYVFMHSSPQVYKDIKNDAPELFERIKERVAEGRWEPEGGMWLEADCNITSGESLVRQFQHGIRFFRQEFGKTCTYLWLPDVFGYSWALPQILKLSGIKTFATTKISWNQFNTMPNDVFRWRGIDGTDVLTYFIDVPSSVEGIDKRGSTYNANIDPVSVLGGWKKFQNKELTNSFLISYGHGDGGGGVDHDMLKMRRAMDRIPGLPNVKAARAGAFFDKLHEDIARAEADPVQEVPVWDGELYLEYHRGTYTSQAHNKKNNRRSEFALCKAEWLSALSFVLGGGCDAKTLYDSWDTVLELQFHDIIPGSSIREVYEDCDVMYAKILSDAERVTKDALSHLVNTYDGAYTVCNFGSFPRTDLVFVPAVYGTAFVDDAGQSLEIQETEGGVLVRIDVPALSLRTFFSAAGAPTFQTPFSFDGSVAESPHYTLQYDERGFLCRIYDKDEDREVLKAGGFGNALEVFEDKPIKYDNWDIDIFYTQKKEFAVPDGPVTLKENGPLRMVVSAAYTYGHSRIEQDMIVYRDNRRIDFKTHVDWHEDHRLLKAAFDTSIRTTKATYDIQYGHVERPTHFNNSWDWARFEVVGHKWGDLSEQNYGVAILNDCKYGYSAKDGTIKLSLLKSGKHPDTMADMGEHDFTYALYPHADGPVAGGVIEESVALNLPLTAVSGQSPFSGRSLFAVEGTGIHIDAVKKAEDSDQILLRFHECFGGTQKVRITSDFGIKAFTACDLLAQPLEETVEADAICRTVRPFEIVNYLVRF